MADTKISDLVDGVTIESTDEFAVARAGTNRRVTTGVRFTGGGSIVADVGDPAGVALLAKGGDGTAAGSGGEGIIQGGDAGFGGEAVLSGGVGSIAAGGDARVHGGSGATTGGVVKIDGGLGNISAGPIEIGLSTTDTKLKLSRTITPGGTTTPQTIDKMSGSVNAAAAATSVVVTNSLVAADSIVLAAMLTNDATAQIKNVVPGAGSFTVNFTAAATAEVRVGFLVLN